MAPNRAFVQLRRILRSGYTNWGALRVLNDDVVAPGKGFGEHPHADMEILTYVLSGELAHRDSMGNVRVVWPGGVQYLSAGTGIEHAEFNGSATAPLHFLQMWVVPRAVRLAPNYGQIDFTVDDRRDRWLTIASGEAGVPAPIAIHQDATFSVARLERARLGHRVAPGRLAFLFVAEGDVVVGGETLRTGDAMRILGPYDIDATGAGELVLWDVPPLAAH